MKVMKYICLLEWHKALNLIDFDYDHPKFQKSNEKSHFKHIPVFLKNNFARTGQS